MQHGAPNETLTCQTFEEQLSSRIWSIEVLLRDFLLKHARLERVNPRSNGIIFLNIQGDYAYRECNIEGQRLLGKVRIKFGQTVDLMDVVLAAHGADITKPYTDGRETIEKILKQMWSHSRTVEQEAEKAKGAFTKCWKYSIDCPTTLTVLRCWCPTQTYLLISPILQNCGLVSFLNTASY